MRITRREIISLSPFIIFPESKMKVGTGRNRFKPEGVDRLHDFFKKISIRNHYHGIEERPNKIVFM